MKLYSPCAGLAAAIVLTAPVIAETLHDPTQPPAARAAASALAVISPLRVEAIFSSGTQRTAIVEGKLVRQGDRVGTAVIEDITTDTVRYSRGGRSEVARLQHSTVRVRRLPAKQEDPL